MGKMSGNGKKKRSGAIANGTFSAGVTGTILK
jgi:hypothetical protein